MGVCTFFADIWTKQVTSMMTIDLKMSLCHDLSERLTMQ